MADGAHASDVSFLTAAPHPGGAAQAAIDRKRFSRPGIAAHLKSDRRIGFSRKIDLLDVIGRFIGKHRLRCSRYIVLHQHGQSIGRVKYAFDGGNETTCIDAPPRLRRGQ